jgi:nucleotide-binding universal stress UspA family protein
VSGVILAVTDRPETTPRVLAAAARLADLTGASRINVLVVRTPPDATISPSEEVLTRHGEERIREAERWRADALKRIYTAWSSGRPATGAVTEWTDIESLADEAVADRGQRADFIVLSRPMDHPLDQERLALRAALFETARPVLVVPAQGTMEFGRRVAIAWRDDRRAVKAVIPALRCLAAAEAVHVLIGVRAGSAAPAMPPVLLEHRIAASLHVLPIGSQPFGQALLDAAHRLRADVLVMGAYAHSPLREYILGGVTRYMLEHADIPVLMRH